MYDSCHFVGLERFARRGHWMSRLGMQGIGEVKSYCKSCELA